MKSKKESLKAITEGESLKRSSGSSSSNGGKQLTTSNYRGRRLLFPSGPLRSQQHQQSFSKRGGGITRLLGGETKVSCQTLNLLSKSLIFLKVRGMEESPHVHPIIKSLFSKMQIPQKLLAGRLQHFLPAWNLITKDQAVLSVIQGYKIPFKNPPVQGKHPTQSMDRSQSKLIDQEIQELLEKGAMSQTSSTNGEFLSNLFLVPKKDGGCCPVINLKSLNKSIPINISRWRVSIV